MGRIPPDRPGYLAYACIGVPQYAIDPVDCAGNRYKQLPPLAIGPISDFPWLDMGAVAADSRLHAMVMACNVDFDPFEGTEVDLRLALLDHGFSSLLPDTCYEADGRYATGFTNPHPFFPDCGCGLIPPYIPPEESSVSSESSVPPAKPGTCGITWYWNCDPWSHPGWVYGGVTDRFCFDYGVSSDTGTFLCCDPWPYCEGPHPEGWDCLENYMAYYTKLGGPCNAEDCADDCYELWNEGHPPGPSEECLCEEVTACCKEPCSNCENLIPSTCVDQGGTSVPGVLCPAEPEGPWPCPRNGICFFRQGWMCNPPYGHCDGWQKYGSEQGCYDPASERWCCGDGTGYPGDPGWTPGCYTWIVYGGACSSWTCGDDCGDTWSTPSPYPPEECFCEPCGVCCLPDDVCDSSLYAWECAALGGTWYDFGTGAACPEPGDPCPKYYL